MAGIITNCGIKCSAVRRFDREHVLHTNDAIKENTTRLALTGVEDEQ